MKRIHDRMHDLGTLVIGVGALGAAFAGVGFLTSGVDRPSAAGWLLGVLAGGQISATGVVVWALARRPE